MLGFILQTIKLLRERLHHEITNATKFLIGNYSLKMLSIPKS